MPGCLVLRPVPGNRTEYWPWQIFRDWISSGDLNGPLYAYAGRPKSALAHEARRLSELLPACLCSGVRFGSAALQFGGNVVHRQGLAEVVTLNLVATVCSQE
jgi:hypothetical protein